MADQPIHDPLDFSTSLTQYETSDPSHATTFNPKAERLINNDAYLDDVKLERTVIAEASFSAATSKTITLNAGGSHYQYAYSVYCPTADVVKGIDDTVDCAYIKTNATNDVLQLDNLDSGATYYYKVWEVS